MPVYAQSKDVRYPCACVRARMSVYVREGGEPRNTWNNCIHLSLLLNHNHDDKSDTAAERAGGILPRNISAELKWNT